MNLRLALVGAICAAATTPAAALAQQPGVTVYSSLPLQGASGELTASVTQGMRLALDEAGAAAGGIPVTFRSLDDSTALAGNWTPEATSRNARRACADGRTAIYLGEFNSGATAVSLPILNACGVPQISPSNTATGLTARGPGALPGEPEVYYPTGRRTYARVVPNDLVQGAALATLMRDECRRVAIAHDGEPYGEDLAGAVRQAARRLGVRVVVTMRIDPRAVRYRKEAQRARRARADCFLYAGITANNAVQLYRNVAATLPRAKLYGGDGIAESGFSEPSEGGVPASVGRRVRVSIQPLERPGFPAPGQDVFRRVTERFKVRDPYSYAVYGYEAMSLALDAIARSGDGSRGRVLDALFATRDRQSVLGTYSIDANGDTTLREYGVYRIRNGEFVFDRTIVAR